MWLKFAAAEGHTARLSTAHSLAGAVEVHISVPVVGALNATALQLKTSEV